MTRATPRTPAALALALALAAGCGGDYGAGEVNGGPPGDGGGVPTCTALASFAPATPVAPVTIVATGSLDKHAVAGVEDYRWTVTRQGADVPFTERALDGSEIEFAADTPGPYQVTLAASVGDTECDDLEATVNVLDPGALPGSFRLRAVPRPDQPAPPQELLRDIPGGADHDLGAITLSPGVIAAGTVTGPGGAPTAAYLRATPVGDAAQRAPLEAFADDAGAFELRLGTGTYEVLVVPAGNALAPALFTGLLATQIAGALSLPAGDAVTGTVVDAAGDPVPGARVALTVAGVPSTIATTGADGAFALEARLGGAAALTVVPDAPGLPALQVDPAAGLAPAAGAPLAIGYAAGLAPRTESFTVVNTDGATPVAGARVALVARPIAGAGAVTPQDGAPIAAAGAAHREVTADETGHTGAITLPPAVYDVVAARADGSGATLLTVNLTGGATAPAALALAPPATVTGAVTGASQSVRVTAVPRGLLARAAAPTVHAQTGAGGAFSLPLVGGGDYELQIVPPPGVRRARLRTSLTAPPAGGTTALADLALPAAIRVTGTLAIPGVAGGASGVHVMLLCGACSGPDASIPLAEAVTDAAGRFELLVPDPGTSD